MVNIEHTSGASTFKINNITQVRNFHTYVWGNKLRIVNAYDTCNELLPYTLYSDIAVNGTVYASIIELTEVLSPILFSKQGGGGVVALNGNTITKSIHFPIDWTNAPVSEISNFVAGKALSVNKTERVLFRALRKLKDYGQPNWAELHYWEFKPGKGNYGIGGIPVEGKDVEHISYVRNFQENIINIGEISSVPIEIYVNGTGPFDINHSALNIFEATRSGTPVVYIYIGQNIKIGIGEGQTVSSEYIDILAEPLHNPTNIFEISIQDGTGAESFKIVDEVRFEGVTFNPSEKKIKVDNLNQPEETTYAQLKIIKDADQLTIGKKYVITDYQCKYIINGSDTSKINQNDTVDALLYDFYIHFATGIILPAGTVVTIVSVPDGGNTGLIGNTYTVTVGYASGDHTIPGFPTTVGIGVNYEAPFYEDLEISTKTIKERFYAPLTGTITSVKDVDTITGTGTSFTTELIIGDIISYIDDSGKRIDRTISSITSDIELIVSEVVAEIDIATDVPFELLTFGKDLMRDGGIVNTEVHNGEDYSGLIASENPIPPIERIAVTAISPNSFLSQAESSTFSGDVLLYDFDDSDIKDRAGRVQGTRNGKVYFRENKKLKIKVDQDWRAKRFRRFRMNDKHWNRIYYNGKELYKLPSGSQTYYVGGISNLSRVEKKRYTLVDVQDSLQIMDFTRDGQNVNPFNDGFLTDDDLTFYPNVDYDRADISGYGAFSSQNPFSDFLFTLKLGSKEIKCRDLFLFPLENNEPKKPVVERFEVDKLENSIFQDLNKGEGVSDKINISAGTVSKCTALTGGKIESFEGATIGFTSFEDFDVKNSGIFENVINFSSLVLKNSGTLLMSQFGGSYNYPINFIGRSYFDITDSAIVVCTVFGIGTTDVGRNIITDTLCKDVLFKYFALANNVIRINGCFMSIANHEDNDYGSSVWFQISATTGNYFNIRPGHYKRTGEEYWLTGPVRDFDIKTNPITKELYYEEVRDGVIKPVILSTPTVVWADVHLELAVDNMSPNEGDTIVITVSVRNDSLQDAMGVMATALLPEGLSYVSDDGAGAYDEATGKWDIGRLTNEGNRTTTLEITATVNGTGSHIVNASVIMSQGDLYTTDNTATLTLTPKIVDVGVSMVVDNAAPAVGSNVVFTLTAINNLGSATGVSVTDLLPSGYAFVSDDGAGTYDDITGIWTVGSLAELATTTLNITVTVKSTGDYTNSATITANEFDNNATNDMDSVTPVPFNPEVDLKVELTADNLSPTTGTNVIITITASNNSGIDATATILTALLPAGFAYVSDNGAGAYNSGTGEWNIGALLGSGNEILTITATINATDTLNASITANEPETNASDNSDSITITPV